MEAYGFPNPQVQETKLTRCRTVASVATIPDGEDVAQHASDTPFDPSPPSDALKRRRSSQLSESAKRPRLSVSAGPAQSPAADDTTVDPGERPPASSRKRASHPPVNKEEERKRGKRLFGGLLSTLSQGAPSTRAVQKRAEVEERQREKLRAQDEENEIERRQYLEHLRQQRWQQQRRWDEESMRLRHDSVFAEAHFLRTKTRPSLYFKPYTLLPSQERKIEDQLDDAERDIDGELAQQDRSHDRSVGGRRSPYADRRRRSSLSDRSLRESPPPRQSEGRGEEPNRPATAHSKVWQDQEEEEKHAAKVEEVKDHADEQDVAEDAGEDQVIY